MRKQITRKWVLKDVETFISEPDGKEFDNENECIDHEETIKGLRKPCPNCKGKGFFYGKWIEAYDNYDIGHVDGHYETNICHQCGGKGYLRLYKTEEWK